MKQRNASSFATLRISTLLAVLWAVQATQASAIPIALTGGGISVERVSPFEADRRSFIGLAGPGFGLTTVRDPFQFSGNPNPLPGEPDPMSLIPPDPPGSTLSFSGLVWVISGSDPGEPGRPVPATVLYGGESYFATGFIDVRTPTAVVGPLVTVPFSLSGQIHATNFMGTDFDFEIFGAGTVTAHYSQAPRIPTSSSG
jgi:hypothetical protein